MKTRNRSIRVRLLSIIVSIAMTVSSLAGFQGVTALAATGWQSTGNLALARSNGTSVTLPNGKIMVLGGQLYGESSPNCEIYDPLYGSWSPAQDIPLPDVFHLKAIVLKNGNVLVSSYYIGQSAEYDPAAGTWSEISIMSDWGAQGPSLALLPNGWVLAAGDWAMTQVYDPESKLWAPIMNPLIPQRRGIDLVTLNDGRVLLSGGYRYTMTSGWQYYNECELFDPALLGDPFADPPVEAQPGLWTETGYMSIARTGHSSVLLPDGRVFTADGSSAEIYSPGTGQWRSAAQPPAAGISKCYLLRRNTVLCLAGNPVSSMNYNLVSNTWSAPEPLNENRSFPISGRLEDGSVLVAGGYSLNTAELYSSTLPPVILDPIDGVYMNVRDITVAGSAEPGDHVRVYQSGAPVAETSADENGAWSATVTIDPAANSAVFSARVVNAYGTESRSSNIVNVLIDTDAPAASVNSPAFSTDESAGAAFTVAWSGTDPTPGSGVTSYDVEYKADNGFSWLPWKTGVIDTSAIFTGTAGSTYTFRARAMDAVGNIGEWTYGASTIVPYDDTVLELRGAWKTLSNTSLYGGTSSVTSVKSSWAQAAFTDVRSVTLIVTKRPDGGKANVYIDNVLRATIDCAGALAYRVPVMVAVFGSPTSGTVRVEGVKTKGNDKTSIELDGIALGR